MIGGDEARYRGQPVVLCLKYDQMPDSRLKRFDGVAYHYLYSITPCDNRLLLLRILIFMRRSFSHLITSLLTLIQMLEYIKSTSPGQFISPSSTEMQPLLLVK